MVGKVLYIKYKEIVDGQIVEKVRYAVDRWQADDKYMGESFITFTVKSSKPIAFSVGDYCEYRGETYTLNYIPSVSQRANIGGSGEAFVYEQVKMDSPREELDRAIMLDVTPTTGDYIAALGTNYTGSAQFQLYCGETTANGRTLTPVCALAAKMQANLDRAFPDKGWKVLVDTTSTHEEAGQQVLNTHSDEKTLTFDNTTIANALAEVKNTFEIDFAVKGRTIYIGYTFGAITGNNDGDYYYFGYGKGYLSEDNQGKALFELKRTSDSGQKIVTRLRALGSTKNMPYRYYNKKYNLSQSLFPMNLQLPDTFETPEVKAKHNKERKAVYPWIRDVLGDTNDAYIDKNDNCLDTVEGLREDCMRWDGTNADLKEIYPSIEEVTYGELRAALCEDQDGNKGSSAFPHYGNNERVDEILDIDTDTNVGDGILTESDSTRQTASDTDVRLTSSETSSSLAYNGSAYASKEVEVMSIASQYAGNYIISNSHLWFRASYSLGRHQSENITKTCKVAYRIKVYAKDLSTNKESVICTYISDYKQISNRGAKEYEVEIAKLPDVDAEVQKVDKITVTNPSDIRITFALLVIDIDYSYDQWNVNWNLGLSLYQNPDTDTEWTPSLIWDLEGSASTFMKNPFHVYVKDMGFDFVAAFGTSDTPRIAMKSGMCVAREFEIGNNPQKVEYTKGGITYKAWRLTLAKAEDSSLKTYYPSENFPLAAGDNFVIIGIEMPDVYIQAASMKLLVEATKALADVCDTKHEYEPSVDGIYIQRNYDRCEEEGDVTKSVYWKLSAGMKFPFFGIAEEGKETPDMFSMIIDTLSIREGEGLTPNISIKLSEDFQQSTLQKLTRTVTSITNGSIFKATNIGNGGGLDESSVRAIVSEFTKRRFLSKLNPDTAAGVITFLQGTNWGNFTSETGAAMTVDPTTGQTYMEVDRLKVRLKAFFEKLEIQKVGFVGGKLIVTKGQGVDILDVEEVYDTDGDLTAYRCYFLGEQEGRKIDNLLRVKDQMICKDFNVSEGSTDGATNKYYWRLATAVSTDVVKRGNNVCHWVDLSATDCDTNSDIPEIGDTICHLGNREDTDRQGAEILSVVDANSPSFTIYSGINNYSLVNKEYIDMGVVNGKAYCNIYGSTYIGDRERKSGYLRWNDDTKTFEIKGTIDITSPLSSGGTIGGAIDNAANAYKGEFDAFTSNVNEVIGGFQAQIDGVIETWFYDPEPTLGNLPASEWKDNTTKDKHLGDLYYSGEGKAYRFQKEGDNYVWQPITDTDIAKALEEAKKANDAANAAQGTADSKMRVFVVQPTADDEYSVGDMWVNATYGTQYKDDILKCKTPKSKGTAFSIDHWEKASKYSDDTKANEALTKVGDLQTDVTELGDSFVTLTDVTLPAISDGIITTSEKENIRQALMQVQKECVDVINAYTNLTVNYKSIYDNIAADVRTNFATAYTNLMGSATLSSDGTITYTSGQGGAYGALVDNINVLLNKEGNLTTNEIATINNNIANFNIKYNDFQNRLVVVRNDIEKTLDTRITKVDEQLGGYAYLKKIVGGKTTIDGGLVLTTMLGTGYEVTGGAYKIMSGISGLYETAKSVAIWAGGSMIDKFVYYDAENKKFNVPDDVTPANFLVRMDGTGYAAGGNFWWDNDGKIHADPQSFLINEQYVGNVMQLFQLHYKVAGDTAFTNVDYVTPTRMFNGLELSDLGLKIGDTAKLYIKDGVLFIEGDLAVTGGITMYASNGVTSGLLDQVYAIMDSTKFEIENGVITIKGEIGDGKVKGATLGGVAVTLNANGILEFDAYPTTLPASDVYAWAKAATKPTYSWGEITEKPSSFTPSAHTHDDRYYTESEIDTKLGLKLDTSLKGAADGLATLDSSGKVPSSQLPSYVDDVLECINKASFPSKGESGKIYIDQTTNLTYRWGGSAYVEISQSLALGETSSTAYAGDKGKQNAIDIAALQTGKADKATTLSGYGITDAYTKTEVDTKLTDGSVTKIGTEDVGSVTLPIYLKAGVPTAVGTSLAVDITGNSATATKLANARTLWGQSFDGSANVSGNMTGVGTITPTGEDLKVVGNLIVTGGIVMYADDGATIESGFAALLAAHIDGVTIKQNNQGKIYSVMTGIKVNGTTYKPSETDGYITIPDYPTSLDWENIENKPSTFTPASHTHTFASLTSKPTTLSGYGITDAKIANGVITLGTGTITPLTAHQKVTLASGTNNGTLKLTVGSTTTDNIAVKGLGSAAYTASSAYAAASHTHSQYLVAASLDGYVNALTDNTSTNVFVTAISKSGKTLSYTKSFTKKSLTAASHSGWSSADTDKLIIPDMSFIAYWNGAYNSNGNSNLAYCNKGAFGDMATASKSSYYTKTEVNTKLTDGSVTKVGTVNVGATNVPIYLKAGVPTAVTLVDTANNLINNLTTGTSTPEDADYYVAQYVNGGTTTTTFHRRPHSALYAYIKGKAEGTWAISISGNAATASKLGTANVGSGTQHFYLSGGTATASTSTVGGTAKPMYLKAGVMTAISDTVGGTAKPIFLNSGTLTAISATVGSASKPVYLNGGSITACSYDFTSYLPLSGGTMGGTAWIVWPDSGNWSNNNSGVTFPVTRGGLHWVGQSDWVKLYSQETGSDNLNLVLQFGDDNSNGLSIRNNGGSQTAFISAAGHITAANGTVNGTLKVGAIPVTNSSTGVLKIDGNLIVTGGITMYATDGVASGLMEQILVDGTTIGKKADGTLYAINTGNVRSIVMGSTTYTPNDSGAVTLPEKVTWANIEGKPSTFAPSSHTHAISQITNLQATLDGKAAASHTHSYLPLAGGTMTGVITLTSGSSAAYDKTALSFIKSSDKTEQARIGTDGGNGLGLYANGSIYIRPNVTLGSGSTNGLIISSSSFTYNGTAVSLAGHTHSYLPLSGGTMTGIITGNTGNGLIVQSANTGAWKEGLRIYPASNNYSILSLQSSDSKNIFAMVTNVSSHTAYFDYCKDGSNRMIQMPYKSGTIALTSDLSAYLPLSGGTMTGALNVQTGGIWVQGGSEAGGNNSRMDLTNGMPSGLAYNTSKRGVRIYSNAIAFADPYNGNTNNDAGWIRHLETSANVGVLEIAVGDDAANESIVVRRYNTSNAVANEAYLLNSSGNTSFPGTVSAAAFSGNASSATKLTSSAGSATLPIYFSDGKPVACTASSVFSNLSNSGNNISVTVAGQNRTLTVGYASNAENAYHLPYTTSTCSNTNNYRYHRILTTPVISNSWNDRTGVFMLSADFNGGCFGIFRVSLRTNNASDSSSKAGFEMHWLYKHNLNDTDLQAGFNNTHNAAYADIFFVSKGLHYGVTITRLNMGARGGLNTTAWNFVKSYEVNDTTTSDKKSSVEVYTSIENAASILGRTYTSVITSAGTTGSIAYATSAGNSDTCDGLHVHGGRNNEANKIVRTDGSGYLQVGYINSSNGHEKNASSPTYVWGSNSSDSYLRSYQTSKLAVYTASKWQTARKITLTGSVTGSVSIDGSGDVTLATTTNHTHSYLPLSGGTISGNLAVTNSVTFLSEAKLKMWNVTSTRNSNYGAEMVFVQTSIDGADPETKWPDKNRNDLFLQPKGGHVHIGPIETAQDYTCYVAGTLRATGTITAPTFSGALSGNASTASKWATARTLTLTGSVTGSVSIDGSGNVTLTTTTNHTHSYLPLSGGTMTGQIQRAGQGSSWIKGRDNAMIRVNSKSGYSVLSSIKTTNGSWEIGHYDASGYYNNLLFGYYTDDAYSSDDNNGRTKITFTSDGHIKATQFNGALNGNAATASKWATARTITLSGSVTGSVSIDGSGNVSLATTTNHTHAYLPLAGGTMTGSIGVQSNVQNGGLKFNNNNANLNAYNDQHLILGKAIRFGVYNTWDWDIWAGLKYDWPSKTIYLGIADGTTFSANNAQSGGSLRFPGVSTVYATTFNGALNGNASTATNADKLDGVHYENILDRTFTKASRISSAGWYRIAQTNTYNGHGASFILVINRLFNNNNNEAYTFSVNITYSGVAITQISGYANDTLISKIRIDKPSGNNTCYVDIYYNSSSGNDVRYFTIGNAVCISATANPTLVGTATEFSTSDGISTNKNILADGGITMHNTSDRRLKKNIRGFNACDELMKLGGVYQFEYIDEEIERNKIYKGSHIGLLYQNVKGTILDKMCFEREDGYGALNYLDTSFISLLAGVGVEHETRLRGIEGAFKKYESKTDKKIRLMRKKINELEKANESLEARVKELEERRTA